MLLEGFATLVEGSRRSVIGVGTVTVGVGCEFDDDPPVDVLQSLLFFPLRLQSRRDVSAAIAVVGFEQISGSTLPSLSLMVSLLVGSILTIVPTCNTVQSFPSNPPMDPVRSCRSRV